MHPTKSHFISQQIVLGFYFVLKISDCKTYRTKNREYHKQLPGYPKKKHVTLTEFSKLIRKLVAAEPGVEYGPLFYKPLEQEKEKKLKLHYGKESAFMKLADSVRTHILTG